MEKPLTQRREILSQETRVFVEAHSWHCFIGLQSVTDTETEKTDERTCLR